MWRAGLLAFVALVTPLSDDTYDYLKTKLANSDARQRREAVAELAKLKTLDAWKLVIGALKDSNSQVADEAQMQVAAIDDAAAMKQLVGNDGLESRDDWVRLRVAEALGRMNLPPSDPTFSKLLNDKSADVRRTACWSIQRLSKMSLTLDSGVLGVFLRDKDSGARAAGLVAFARRWVPGAGLEIDLDTAVERALADPAYEIRAAAVVARNYKPIVGPPPPFWTGVVKPAKDVHVGVRLCAAEYLAGQRTREAALQLVVMLEVEKELRARWRIIDLLRALSGLNHRLDPRPWRAWADALPADWHGESKPPAQTKDDGEMKTASFVGLPILSEHVCFVIDLSGSMWAKNKDGKMRKSIVDEELKRALEALPATTEFNLIPFTATPVAWQEHLVPADKKNVAKALDFFNSRRDNGTGNFWDAYMLALEDPKVDTVVMLSDGAPTGGHRWNLTLMRELMAEHNRFRRVALDAVLADASGRRIPQWQAMCDDSGGHLIEVELR